MSEKARQYSFFINSSGTEFHRSPQKGDHGFTSPSTEQGKKPTPYQLAHRFAVQRRTWLEKGDWLVTSPDGESAVIVSDGSREQISYLGEAFDLANVSQVEVLRRPPKPKFSELPPSARKLFLKLQREGEL